MTDPNSTTASRNAKCRTSANADSSAGQLRRSLGGHLLRRGRVAEHGPGQRGRRRATSTCTRSSSSPTRSPPTTRGSTPSPRRTPTRASTSTEAHLRPLLARGRPVATGHAATPFCTLYMGETFGADFTNELRQRLGQRGDRRYVDGQAPRRAAPQPEWFQFSVVGVNQNFSADTAELTQNGSPGRAPGQRQHAQRRRRSGDGLLSSTSARAAPS
jgi:hypothetical protein